ncbi:MAG: Hsp20/alpha crystallin family protein [Bacteroidetes bacterium]|nr:Hsp20/alpha crystallin family protein [Bacteroidota bacterium]
MTLVSVKPQAGRFGFPRFTNWFDTFSENEFTNDFFEGVRTPVLVNTKEAADNYRIEIAAPGQAKDGFKLEVNDNILTISTEKSDVKNEENEKWTRREFHFASFKRSFTLPKTVNAEKISAEYKDGILYVVLPKVEEAKAKGPIEIKVS